LEARRDELQQGDAEGHRRGTCTGCTLALRLFRFPSRQSWPGVFGRCMFLPSGTLESWMPATSAGMTSLGERSA
jgi:hypothetical protein